MAKKVNITDKLDFDGNPSIIIKDQEIELDASAETVLKLMGLLSEGTGGPKYVMEAFNLILPEESRAKISALKLQFNDLMTVVEEAVNIIAGNGEEEGE